MIYSKQFIRAFSLSILLSFKSHCSSCVNTILECYVETFLTMILARSFRTVKLKDLIDSRAVSYFYFPQQRERSETVRSEAESPSSDPRAHDHDWKVHFTLNHTQSYPTCKYSHHGQIDDLATNSNFNHRILSPKPVFNNPFLPSLTSVQLDP